jgi:hypothetical protein
MHSTGLKAQIIGHPGEPAKGTYKPNAELKKYAGNWEYTKGSLTFSLRLKYVPRVPLGSPPNAIYLDQLQAEYSYRGNGKVIIDTREKPRPEKKPSFIIMEGAFGVNYSIYDPNANSAENGRVSFIDLNRIELSRKPYNGVLKLKTKIKSRLVLPEKIVLNRK